MKKLRVIISSIYWTQALQEAARGRYILAREKLKKSQNWSHYEDPKRYALKAFLEYGCKNNDQALVEIEKARSLLPFWRDGREDDRKYLYAYIEEIEKWVREEDENTPNKYQRVEYDFDLSRVSTHLRKSFPLAEM